MKCFNVQVLEQMQKRVTGKKKKKLLSNMDISISKNAHTDQSKFSTAAV